MLPPHTWSAALSERALGKAPGSCACSIAATLHPPSLSRWGNPQQAGSQPWQGPTGRLVCPLQQRRSAGHFAATDCCVKAAAGVKTSGTAHGRTPAPTSRCQHNAPRNLAPQSNSSHVTVRCHPSRLPMALLASNAQLTNALSYQRSTVTNAS